MLLADAGFDVFDTWLNETHAMFKADAIAPPRKVEIAYASPDRLKPPATE